jgi:hypothetical protein
MKIQKHRIRVAFAVGVALLAPVGYGQNLGVIDQAVADAKAKGAKTATIPRWGTTPEPWPDTVDVFLNKYTFVLAEPVAVTVTRDQYRITTWTRLHVLETLYPQKNVAAVGIVIPESIAPPAPDEVILHTDGGEMVVNGVTVRQEGGPQLKKGMEYMLVLQLQSNGKVAVPAAGEAGVFEAEAGAQLKPIVASNLADNLRERGMIMVQALRIWLRHRML